MFGITNIQTTLASLAPFFASVALVASLISERRFPSELEITVLVAGFGSAYGLFSAKDKGVTGGTISAVTGETSKKAMSLVDTEIAKHGAK